MRSAILLQNSSIVAICRSATADIRYSEVDSRQMTNLFNYDVQPMQDHIRKAQAPSFVLSSSSLA
jgi:hypothetical protein